MSASRSQSAYKGPPARHIDDLERLRCFRCQRTLAYHDAERRHEGHIVLTCQRCKCRLEMLDGTLTSHDPERKFGVS